LARLQGRRRELDLDDIGSELGEKGRRQRAGEHGGAVDNSEPS